MTCLCRLSAETLASGKPDTARHLAGSGDENRLEYSPARRPVRRLTCRSWRSTSLRPARRRISGYRSRRSLTTTQTRPPTVERAPRVREHLGDTGDVLLDRGAAGAARGAPELEVAALVEAEKLVGVAVLTVVLDQARIRRRRDDAVVRPLEIDRARVAVQHPREPPVGTHGGEGLDPVERVERVAEEEAAGRLDGLALAPVLVAPVGLETRLAREVEVEVRRPAGRAGGAGKHDAEDVGGAHLVDERAVVEQLLGGGRRVPGSDVRRRLARVAATRLECLSLGVCPVEVAAQRVEVVGARLDADEQCVEAGDVDSGRVIAGLECLDERRSRARERVEDAAPAATWRSSSTSTSCGMNLPRYGCRRWTCFVRSRSGRELSDQESSRSSVARRAPPGWQPPGRVRRPAAVPCPGRAGEARLAPRRSSSNVRTRRAVRPRRPRPRSRPGCRAPAGCA